MELDPAGRTQLDRDGSALRLKLWKVLGGGLLIILSTSRLHSSGSVPVSISSWMAELRVETTDLGRVSVSVSEPGSEWESRPTPEPGVGPRDTELEVQESRRSETEDEEREVDGDGLGGEQVDSFLPDKCQTMM